MMTLQATTAVALILGFAALARGALMYWLRGGMRGGAPPSRRYLVWERSFIMAAVVLTAVGLVLLADLLAASAGAAMALAGAVAYLFGGVLVVAAEASGLGRGLHQDWPAQSWSLAVVYSCWRCWPRRPLAARCSPEMCCPRDRLGHPGLEHRMAGVLPATERRHLDPIRAPHHALRDRGRGAAPRGLVGAAGSPY